jgi:hypothetical protein
MPLPAKARSAARSNTTSMARKSSAASKDKSRRVGQRRIQFSGSVSRATNGLASVEMMFTTREGREIIAEALRAAATVLDTHNQHNRSLQSGDPVASPTAEMIAGTFGVARTAADLETGAETSVMLGGTGAPDAEIDVSKGSRQTGTRQSSHKRTLAGSE